MFLELDLQSQIQIDVGGKVQYSFVEEIFIKHPLCAGTSKMTNFYTVRTLGSFGNN